MSSAIDVARSKGSAKKVKVHCRIDMTQPDEMYEVFDELRTTFSTIVRRSQPILPFSLVAQLYREFCDPLQPESKEQNGKQDELSYVAAPYAKKSNTHRLGGSKLKRYLQFVRTHRPPQGPHSPEWTQLQKTLNSQWEQLERETRRK